MNSSKKTWAVLSLLIACVPALGQAAWPANYDAALSQARSERKLILVDLRPGADPTQDRFIELSEAEPPIVRAYRSFILVRIEASAVDRPPSVTRLLAQRPPVPSFVVVDPAGTYVTSWAWFDDLSTHLNYLNLSRGEIKAMLEAYDVRESGAPADADVLLAAINLRITHVFRARDLYSRAVDEYLMQSKDEPAQIAAIGIQVTNYLVGMQKASLSELRKMISSGTPQVAAAAHLAIGKMYDYSKETKAAAAALHEALRTARRGSPEWTEARNMLLRLGDRSILPQTSGEATIRIVVPHRPTLAGNTEFSTSTDARVANVQWFLDSKPVRGSDERPFRVRINLGPTPRLHSVEAVGFDSTSNPLARATTTVNDRLDELRMHIVSPAIDKVAGLIRLEADAYVPPGRTLEMVEFSWNDQTVGRFSSPPYRAEFEAPSSFGYFRAVGKLDDGQTAEDARVLNAGEFSANVDVHNVAFAATVVDHQGHRVNGLQANDFAAFDENSKIELGVRDAENEPVTIGLAVDLSSSMTTLLLPLMRLGSRFIESALRPHDKMFLVTFDEQPRLIQASSSDASALKSRLQDVFAIGGTALADALAFTMQQFTGTTGKKALVLITDGNEGVSEQRTNACVEMAKEGGVPIYVIVPQESGDAEGGPAFRRVLRQMSNVTGGLMFYRPRREEIPAVVARIRDEVRGQYLMAFPAAQGQEQGTWRKLRVELPGRPGTVRTIGGYYAR